MSYALAYIEQEGVSRNMVHVSLSMAGDEVPNQTSALNIGLLNISFVSRLNL
jgi:hypothetical protein